MSQTKYYPKIRIFNENPGTCSTGMNTVVELDGKRLTTASFIKIEAHAKRTTKVMIEMFADVEFEGDVVPKMTSKNLDSIKLKNRLLVINSDEMDEDVLKNLTAQVKIRGGLGVLGLSENDVATTESIDGLIERLQEMKKENRQNKQLVRD